MQWRYERLLISYQFFYMVEVYVKYKDWHFGHVSQDHCSDDLTLESLVRFSTNVLNFYFRSARHSERERV